ncbi:DNA repair protein [Wickerhamomyces ciferrii]|uniref:DNA repair protein RAD50 n=1 Tax=Wickerhamomyces ciferrii (strain ATCC 14091 / BCRC 22168 / CBS 111 / JCM 3599 / NBRC 0793 / NRRL Y-1031 F-60-10) TaxID=1206466 RepID=K0KM13_WICCF|nr:DNA repair protein [Wickerhamomyces ciferrii]CCH42168.1 DNA repair protein [Wickerhamomyces ciferrii]
MVLTIIECLKYSTTGDLPPNSKGGAFLHDPKMTDEKEVRAQVKLAFTNASGVSMICTRAMLLTVKRTTATFKTLEGQLLALHRGERTTISTKCAELDAQVPTYLGVSKAILDYVIFCHQDESLWPLAEPSVLKKRFDEIFEALKFTKALDNIKVIRKDMAVEIKLLDQSVKHLKTDKERADRVKEKISVSNKQIEDYREETALLEEDLQRIAKESNELFKSNQEFQKVLSKLESYKHSQRSLNEQISRLEDSTRLLPESDEDIQYKLANFQSMVQEAQSKVNDLKYEVSDKQSNLKTLRQDYSHMIREEGQLKGKEAEYQENLQRRETLVNSIASKLGIDSSSGDVQSFESELTSLVDNSERSLESLVKTAKRAEADLSQKLKLVSDSKLKERQHRDYTLSDIEAHEKEIKAQNNKINDLDVNEGGLEYEKTKLEDLETKLNKLKGEKVVENLLKDIKTKNTEISNLEIELENIGNELSQSHKQADAHAKISLLKDEKRYREKALAKLIETNNEIFQKEQLNIEDLDKSYRAKVNKATAEAKRGEIDLSKLQDQFSKLESEASFKKTTISNYEKELESSLQKYNDEVEFGIDDYDDELGDAEKQYKLALENLKVTKTTLEFNKKALEIAESDHSCFLCSRKFDDKPGLTNFLKALKEKTNGDAEKSFQEDVVETKEYLDSLRSLSQIVDRVKTLKDKVKTLESEVAKSEPGYKKVESEFTTQKAKADEAKHKLESLNDIKNAVSEITRMKHDLSNVSSQLSDKEKELNDYGYSAKSLDELQKEQKEKHTTLKILRTEVNTLLEEKDSKQREVSILEGNVKDKRLAISIIERGLVEKENLLKSIEEYKNKIVKLQEQAAKSNGILEELEEQVNQASSELSAKQRENEVSIKNQQNEVSKFKDHQKEFSNLNGSITYYVDVDSKKLAKCQEEVSLISTLIAEHEEEIESTLARVSDEEKKLADTSSEERNLKNNLDIRHMQKQLDNIEHDIESLDAQNAESERDRYEERSAVLREQYSKMNADLAGKMGEVKQIEDQVKQFEKELRTEFKQVEQAYQEEWVKLQTKTLVSNDLNTYSKALDSAIMQYHSIKMKEINRTIDELWKGTYSGTDVDTIMIKSDQNTASKGNRTYNYRVVMVKQDAELDMRGRCSAGQKVLASIIIRLALAECFGTNCGVIALDEPTTNLDAENIESLARSLGNIIEMRQSQKNFQLIVITHDEKFLTYMNAAKYTDHFYKVRRNEAQKSQIDWVNISRVSE